MSLALPPEELKESGVSLNNFDHTSRQESAERARAYEYIHFNDLLGGSSNDARAGGPPGEVLSEFFFSTSSPARRKSRGGGTFAYNDTRAYYIPFLYFGSLVYFVRSHAVYIASGFKSNFLRV